jgi:hypothetical protein
VTLFGKLPGWMSRTGFRGESRNRFFADARCGGSDLAYAAARDHALADLANQNAALSLGRRLNVRQNTPFHMPGVARYMNKRTGHAFWVAYWNDARGIKRSRKFSALKYGEQAAFELACAARLDAVQAHATLLNLLKGADAHPERGQPGPSPSPVRRYRQL